MELRQKTFAELSLAELYAILKLRSDVFIVEQVCVFQDIDDLDQKTLHLMLWDGERLAGYLRIMPPGLKSAECYLQRIIVEPSYRAKKLGHDLVRRGLEAARRLYPHAAIKLNAQAQLQKFYGAHGFAPISEIYDDCGQPHVDMVLKAA